MRNERLGEIQEVGIARMDEVDLDETRPVEALFEMG